MYACSGNLCTNFHTLTFINNSQKSGVLPTGFSSFLVNLSLLSSVSITWFVIELSHSDLGLSILVHSLEVIRWIMSYRTYLRKYIDSTALMALPSLTWVFEWRLNSWDLVIQISHALRISVHLAVQWCPQNAVGDGPAGQAMADQNSPYPIQIE